MLVNYLYRGSKQGRELKANRGTPSSEPQCLCFRFRSVSPSWLQTCSSLAKPGFTLFPQRAKVFFLLLKGQVFIQSNVLFYYGDAHTFLPVNPFLCYQGLWTPWAEEQLQRCWIWWSFYLERHCLPICVFSVRWCRFLNSFEPSEQKNIIIKWKKKNRFYLWSIMGISCGPCRNGLKIQRIMFLGAF